MPNRKFLGQPVEMLGVLKFLKMTDRVLSAEKCIQQGHKFCSSEFHHVPQYVPLLNIPFSV